MDKIESRIKRRKLGHSAYTKRSFATSSSFISNPDDVSVQSSFDDSESSFTFTSPKLPKGRGIPTDDYILDITKYIPIGCLRIPRGGCGITGDVWQSCQSWRAFAHPRDAYNQDGGRFLLNALQELLFSSSTLHPYRGLHNAGWVRMEFKCSNQHWGQVRVYVLPNDLGRGTIDRGQPVLRKAMRTLLDQLDIATATWKGDWSEDTPIAHLDASLDQSDQDQTSLFDIFNTLPSPNPNPEVVIDDYARDAMYRILEGKVEGLTTKMHSYQKRSAATMLQREYQPDQLIDPRLRRMIDHRGTTWYCDIDAGLCLREPRTYEAARGGICAETMGLGKTLICLAIILATRELSSRIPVEYSVGTIPIRKKVGSLMDMAAATLARTGTPWKSDLARIEADGYEFKKIKEAIARHPGHYFLPAPQPRRESRRPVIAEPRKIWLTAATIVVVPANLVQQWCHEIKKHTEGLKVLLMNDLAKPLPPAGELKDYDIILFSKQRFEKESRDGTDSQGRTVNTGAQRNSASCEDVYHSPLRDLHFKRLITDEGHTFGNSSSSSKTDAVTVVEFLQLSARWIVSGTPTQGLYGAETAIGEINGPSDDETRSEVYSQILGGMVEIESTSENGESSDTANTSLQFRQSNVPNGPAFNMDIESSSDTSKSETSEQAQLFYKQERKDLEKLGNIATMYLKARPWANTHEDNDHASWTQLVMQPRHGGGSRGNMECLRATLEGMIIRHRPEDIAQDVTLPPLQHDVVYLDGSIQNKLSLNTFTMMIVTNAVTSERKDADYFFHPRQRKNLLALVSNLRQSSFFWSGFENPHIRSTVENARNFLMKAEVPCTAEDEALLKQAIEVGEDLLANRISGAIGAWHEMPMCIDIQCPKEVREAWSLVNETSPQFSLLPDPVGLSPMEDFSRPLLIGATMVNALQKTVDSNPLRADLMEHLVVAGKQSMETAAESLNAEATRRPRKKSAKDKKANGMKTVDSAPELAGGVTVGEETSPKKRARRSSVKFSDTLIPTMGLNTGIDTAKPPRTRSTTSLSARSRKGKQTAKAKGKAPEVVSNSEDNVPATLDLNSPLASASIVSTASAKLSYLMDRISTHQDKEKILVFYEADNVAYYIAQALECLGIKHLIYAKTLSSARRSQYVVTFNQSEVFRVLLMDVSQAAFGLDLSSASRVYFVNPVFSPQVEAQAVKRAHRIGQVKPVYVETLVLCGSIEEAIMERRNHMSNEEHNKCKNILDDQKMYDWIRNVSFLSLSSNNKLPSVGSSSQSSSGTSSLIPGPEQMAMLETQQAMFCRGAGIATHDPDADLILDDSTGEQFYGPSVGHNPLTAEQIESMQRYGLSNVDVESLALAVALDGADDAEDDEISAELASWRLQNLGTLSSAHSMNLSRSMDSQPNPSPERTQLLDWARQNLQGFTNQQSMNDIQALGPLPASPDPTYQAVAIPYDAEPNAWLEGSLRDRRRRRPVPHSLPQIHRPPLSRIRRAPTEARGQGASTSISTPSDPAQPEISRRSQAATRPAYRPIAPRLGPANSIFGPRRDGEPSMITDTTSSSTAGSGMMVPLVVGTNEMSLGGGPNVSANERV